MLSHFAIQNLRREAALKAQKSGLVPFVPLTAEMAEHPEEFGRVPSFGDYRPTGWRLREQLFVDVSGLGEPGEPAMTQEALAAYMKAHLRERLGYGLIEQGQFQGFVGVFEPMEGCVIPRKRRRTH